MSDVKRLNFTVSQFESVVPYASEHGQYVRFADYAKLEAEAQALRDEVAALRARVVVPERMAASPVYFEGQRAIGWNACLDELARLNGKAVSEGDIRPKLQAIADGLRQLGQRMHSSELNDASSTGRLATRALLELSALLGEGKEVGDA